MRGMRHIADSSQWGKNHGFWSAMRLETAKSSIRIA